MEKLRINLALFGANTNVTGDSGLSNEMKTYYSDYLIDLAEPELIHQQFGQKHPIPKAGGKTIEFRKWNPLPKMLTPLQEGVTPDGQKLSMGVITATVAQYGGYVTLSDILLLTAIDNNLVMATRQLASQAGRTLDTICREVLNGGTNVVYANGNTSRAALVGGDATAANNDYLTVMDIKKAVRTLKVQNAPKINGDYVAIIHPDVAFDLTNDSDWKTPHQYVDTENMYSGEIGKIAGCRFVESTEAKVFHGDDLASDTRTLSVNKNGGYTGAITSVDFDGSTAGVAADALIGRVIQINGVNATVTDNTTTSITFASTDFGTIADDAVIYPGEAGYQGRDVYSTLILGADAYGVTELEGGGLQHIVKQLGSGDDPLNQRATAGWKATTVTERLVEQYMVRVESTSFYQVGKN